MNRKNVIGLFLKYPEPGRVKTRLAKDIGDERAADFSRRIAEYVLKKTLSPDRRYFRIVFYSPETRRQYFQDWLGEEILLPQTGADVGERMQHAITAMFDRGAEKAIVVGTDIPDLRREIIETAFQRLDDADIVIGPAMDGGYYLIGMHSPHPEVFRNIIWSTGTVLRETLDIIKKRGLRCSFVPELHDVDGLEDFLKAEEIMNNTEYA